MTDYIASDSEFAAVADAIRTKGGTSSSLEWPNGFASAISALPSGGGGGIGTLIKKQSLGTITASGSNEADTGISLSVSSVNDYDLLIVETSVDTVVNNRHMATVRIVWLTGTSSVETKNTAALVTGTWNAKASSAGVVTTRQYTTAYGVYPKDPSISNGTVTMEMYKRYSSTYTNTVNGTYTTRVYGVKLYDLIGG